MRAIWKGTISFGLVTIPIALWPATKREELTFRLLRKSDLSPVDYKRVAEADGKEVPWDQIVKGYEYETDRFVVLKEDDFRRVDVEAAQTVDIFAFVELSEINPIFFNKPYYMECLKGGAEAYSLLHDALRSSGKVGIAKVVIKTRQHLAAVKPQGGGLVLELMHFADEIAEMQAGAQVKSPPAGRGELEIAKALIEKMTEKWAPENYQDDYRTALLGLIKEKVKSGGRETKNTPTKAEAATNVVDLVEVLKRSLAETKRQNKKREGPANHRRKAA